MWLSLLLTQAISLGFILKFSISSPRLYFLNYLLLYTYNSLLLYMNSVYTETLLQLCPVARSSTAELPSMLRNLPFCPQNLWE